MTFAQADALGVPAARTRVRWEMLAAAACAAQFSEPFFAAMAQAQGAAEPPGYARLAFVPVYLFLGWALWRDRARAWSAAAATPLLLALLALAFASSLWSIDGGATLRRAVWLALTMSFGLYLAWRYSWRELTEVLAGAFVLLIAGSFIVGALLPSIGRMAAEHPGAWGGLWTHKNTLGGIMALGVAICASAAWLAPARRKLWSAAALGAFALVLLSTSMTALIASCLGLGIIVGAAMARQGPALALMVAAGALGVVIVGASVALLAPDILVAAIGRDLTLTGRTDIWEASAPAVNARPWLGYGYYAFWLPDEGPAYWVRQAVQWEVSSAHSGWLELALG
ncbi:MAG TPA: O-antigen ligase family protein, partial [Terricaulis sp.]|nr:O-antigen ligase family protein [Terricaulis sp.]